MGPTLDVLRALVGFDTTSREPNLDLIGWIEGYLAGHGVATRRVPGPLGKAGLVARIGPAAPGGVLLCGHTDTVPVDGQRWATDPFALTRVGDRVAGRGTVDMKGFIAAALAVVPQAVEADLQAPLWLGFSYDEEIGCLGAAPLADALLADGPPPSWAIIGEATGMAVVGAHKGVRVMRTTVTGTDAHSSQPQRGASAITAAARVVTVIEQAAEERRDHGPRAAGFDPRHTTMNVGTIGGGTAMNIIPAVCELVWEFRPVPGEDPDALLQRILAEVHETVLPRLAIDGAPAGCIDTVVIASVEALDPAGNRAAAAELVRITGAPAGPAAAYGTDAGVLQAAGIPSVLFGPGEVGQMHQPDESIALADLDACVEALQAVVADLARGGSS